MEQQALAMVLATPELVEAVLVYLPLRDLFACQCTNHFWQAIINDSPILQQHLFFQPMLQQTPEKQQPRFNRLLSSLFPALFYSRGGERRYACVNDIKADPWFQECFAGAPKLDEDDWFSFVENEHRAAVLRPEASWRRMFPVQPPARITSLKLSSSTCQKGTYHCFGEIDDEKQKIGATMGLIYDVVVEALDNNTDSSFDICWYMYKESWGRRAETKNEISIAFKAESWYPPYCYCTEPVPTGMRLVNRDQKVAKWIEEERDD